MIVVWDDGQAEIAEIIGSLRSRAPIRAVEVKAAGEFFPRSLFALSLPLLTEPVESSYLGAG